jgi:hypothetical protein
LAQDDIAARRLSGLLATRLPPIHRTTDVPRYDRRIAEASADPDTVPAFPMTMERQQLNSNGDTSMRSSPRRARLATLIGTALVALCSTTAVAQEVTYDFDRSANFSKLHSYAWVRGTPVRDDFNHKRIMDAIDKQLVTKGLGKTEARDQADVLVAYHAAFSTNLEVNGFSSGWGGYRFGPARSGSARVEEILVGTLVVDIIDAKTGTILWRGIATKELDVNASPEKRDKNINKAAEKLFKKYPPSPAAS